MNAILQDYPILGAVVCDLMTGVIGAANEHLDTLLADVNADDVTRHGSVEDEIYSAKVLYELISTAFTVVQAGMVDNPQVVRVARFALAIALQALREAATPIMKGARVQGVSDAQDIATVKAGIKASQLHA